MDKGGQKRIKEDKRDKRDIHIRNCIKLISALLSKNVIF